MAVEEPDLIADWHKTSNFLVLVSVPDELSLVDLAFKAEANGIPVTVVREPDLDNQVTSVALAPCDAARRLCSSLPLALREKVPV